MDRFHTEICDKLYNHFKDGLEPPISSIEEEKSLKDNIEILVLGSNLHPFDNGDSIWKKLAFNKKKFKYWNKIQFL